MDIVDEEDYGRMTPSLQFNPSLIKLSEITESAIKHYSPYNQRSYNNVRDFNPGGALLDQTDSFIDFKPVMKPSFSK